MFRVMVGLPMKWLLCPGFILMRGLQKDQTALFFCYLVMRCHNIKGMGQYEQLYNIINNLKTLQVLWLQLNAGEVSQFYVGKVCNQSKYFWCIAYK